MATWAQFLVERSRLMSSGSRLVVRYAPQRFQGVESGHALLVRDKRRRRDSEATEHEITHDDHPIDQTVSTYWGPTYPGSGWSRSLAASGEARKALGIPALWPAYLQNTDGHSLAPDTRVIFTQKVEGGDHPA